MSPSYHPAIRVSKMAAKYLEREDSDLLTARQVGRALQLPDRNDSRNPGELRVWQLRKLFTNPPNWLRKHHEHLNATAVPTGPE